VKPTENNSSRGGGNPTTQNRTAEVKDRTGEVAERFSKPSPRRSPKRDEEPADCWFCGRWVRVREARTTTRGEMTWRVVCAHCEADGPVRHSSAEAVRAWNGARERWEAAEQAAQVRISDGCMVCLECGCVFASEDAEPVCAECAEGEG